MSNTSREEEMTREMTQPVEHRSLLKTVGLYVFGAGAVGASAGALWGSLSGISVPAFAFGMGANWAAVAGPFVCECLECDA